VLKLSEKKVRGEEDKVTVENTGLLVASGLVAGEALTGILLAAFIVANVNLKTFIGLSPDFEGFWWLGLVVFAILAYVLIKYPLSRLQQTQRGGE